MIEKLSEGLYKVVVYLPREPSGKYPRVSRRVHGSREDAKRLEVKLLSERNAGKLRSRPGRLGEYLTRYVESRRHELAASTIVSYTYLSDTYVLPRLGGLRLDRLDPLHLRELYAALFDAGLSGTTVNAVHRFLHVALRRAAVDGLIPANPADLVCPPRKDTVEARALTMNEARELLSSLEGTPVHVPAMLALSTGMRRYEVIALKWDDIDGAAIRILVGKTERGRRTVYVGAEMQAALKRHRAAQNKRRLRCGERWRDEGYVFPSTKPSPALFAGRYWTPAAFSHCWRRHAPAGIGFHTLRHTAITELLRAGVRDEVVSRIAGHSSSAVTRAVYSHVAEDEAAVMADVLKYANGGAV